MKKNAPATTCLRPMAALFAAALAACSPEPLEGTIEVVAVGPSSATVQVSGPAGAVVSYHFDDQVTLDESGAVRIPFDLDGYDMGRPTIRVQLERNSLLSNQWQFLETTVDLPIDLLHNYPETGIHLWGGGGDGTGDEVARATGLQGDIGIRSDEQGMARLHLLAPGASEVSVAGVTSPVDALYGTASVAVGLGPVILAAAPLAGGELALSAEAVASDGTRTPAQLSLTVDEQIVLAQVDAWIDAGASSATLAGSPAPGILWQRPLEVVALAFGDDGEPHYQRPSDLEAPRYALVGPSERAGNRYLATEQVTRTKLRTCEYYGGELSVIGFTREVTVRDVVQRQTLATRSFAYRDTGRCPEAIMSDQRFLHVHAGNADVQAWLQSTLPEQG